MFHCFTVVFLYFCFIAVFCIIVVLLYFYCIAVLMLYYFIIMILLLYFFLYYCSSFVSCVTLLLYFLYYYCLIMRVSYTMSYICELEFWTAIVYYIYFNFSLCLTISCPTTIIINSNSSAING